MTEYLRNLPRNGEALTRLAATPSVLESDPTASPPRKAARIDESSTKDHKGKGKHKASSAKGIENSSKASRTPVQRIQGSALPARFGIDGLPTEFVSNVEPIIRRSLQAAILNHSASPTSGPYSFERIFQACHIRVAYNGKGAEVYQDIKVAISRYVDDVFNKTTELRTGIEWLSRFIEEWQAFETRLSILHSLFIHLDRLYVQPNASEDMIPVRDLGRRTWSTKLLDSLCHQEHIATGVSEWITTERNSALEDLPPNTGSYAMIQSLRDLLILHGAYQRVFEPPLVLETRAYYNVEREEHLKDMSPPEYILHVAARIEQEERRAKACFPAETGAKLLHELEAGLLPTTKFMLTGVEDFTLAAVKDFMTEPANTRALAQMYDIYDRIYSLARLCHAFKVHITEAVKAIVSDPANDTTMITSLITYKRLVDNIVSAAFRVRKPVPAAPSKPSHSRKNSLEDHEMIDLTSDAEESVKEEDTTRTVNQDFLYAVKDAFKAGVSSRKIKPAEMIAKYLDAELRKGQRAASDAQFQETVDDALGLYGFTPDHDAFREFYMRALAKRLLLGRSASDDFEKNFLLKLGKEYDAEFEKGQNMFSDLDHSRALVKEFHAANLDMDDMDDNDDDDATAEQRASARKLSVFVLQPSMWPSYPTSKLILPESMQTALDRFKAFYKTKHDNRVLEWVHSLGTVHLITRFPKGEKELLLSLTQAILMLCFEPAEGGESAGATKLGYMELKERTGMDDDELKRTLQSLALGKKRVLVKKPAGKDVLDTDMFIFNIKFEDKARNVRINSIQSAETAVENAAANKHIDEDRDYLLDATIVRIMKARKRVQFEDLKIAVIEGTAKYYIPTILAIKKKVESLIDREYMDRDDEEGWFNYVA